MNSWPPRPNLSSEFYKAHGLGNDYIVFEEGVGWLADPSNIRLICDRHRGVGSDGIVVLLGGRGGGPKRLRMFNPDGSEFERSGNGLRIVASYLSRGDPTKDSIEVSVGGDVVRMHIHGREGAVHDVSVDMGRAETGVAAVALDPTVISDDGSLEGPRGEALVVVPVSVGNPHMVVIADGDIVEFSDACLGELGPFVATHSALLHGANMQLAQPLAEGRCRALIWERGVGRTSASGTSACAVAVALVSSGRMGPGLVTVEMPGGELAVEVTPDLDVTLRGPVEEICEGRLSSAFMESMRS